MSQQDIVAIEVKHSQLKELIKAYRKHNLALFVWGAPAIGKSDTVRQAAREVASDGGWEYTEDIHRINDPTAFVVLDIRLSQCDPSDLRGLPVFNNDRKSTTWLPPDHFPRSGQGFIFIDELNLATQLTQASSYELILDRKLGSYTVPEGYSLIGAGNRSCDGASVFDLKVPLKTRFGHVQLTVPDVESWSTWALNHGVDVRVVGFLNFKQSMLFNISNHRENTFCTPRTWAHVGKLINGIPSADLETIYMLSATQVGVGPATEFKTFIKIRDKLKPLKYYIDNPETCELPDPNTQLDLTWSLTTSLVEYYISQKTIASLEKIVALLNRIGEEFTVYTMRMIIATDKPSIIIKLTKAKGIDKLTKNLYAFFD